MHNVECVCVCLQYVWRTEWNCQMGTYVKPFFLPIYAHVFIQYGCILHKACIMHVSIHMHVSETAAGLTASTRWHFPNSGCSPDIFLVSDQSWFSQMSHLLRYISLNEGSAAVFAKTQTSMKKTHLPHKAKSSLGNIVILMFAYIVQIHINVFNLMCST